MARGNVGRGAVPFGASNTITIAPGSTQIIPPIPTATTQYTVQPSQLSIRGMTSFGGGGLLPVVLQGGLSVQTMPDTGVARVYAWWPNEPAPLLSRAQPDGSVVPVRGGFPIKPSGLTRNNYCQNPSIEAGINGFVAATGAPTISQVTRTDIAAPNQALKAVIAGAGGCGVKPPHVTPFSNSFNFGFDLLISTAPTGTISVIVSYATSTGGSAGSSTFSMTTAQAIPYVGQFGRISGSVAAPSTAASVTTVEILVGGLPSSGYIELDHIMFSGQDTNTTYADGDAAGASWAGVAELSASVIAPITIIDDGECPLDQSIRYSIRSQSMIGGTVYSPTITLNSNGTTWATHPFFPTQPRRVVVKESDIDKVYPANQGIFTPIGANYPIAVSSGNRQASTGTWVWGVFSYAERDDWLINMLDTLQPILFRMPAAYGYGYGRWYSLGDVTEQSLGLGPLQDMRAFSAPFIEVAGPSAVTF